MTFEGVSVVVTGAGSGVGRATAGRFAAEGANVTCVDLRKAWALETVDQIAAAGGTAQAVECDVADEAAVEAAIASAVAAYGRLDVMINNVGISTPRSGMKLEDHTGEDFDRLVAVNFRGVFHGTKHAILRFKAQGGGGVILNTGSVAGLVGWGGSVYGATKGAVHQLTRAAAIEGAPFKIRVNAICPAGMPATSFLNRDPQHGDDGVARRRGRRGRQDASARRTGDGRGLRRGPALPGVAGRPQRHRRVPPRRRGLRGAMSEPGYVKPDTSLLGDEHVRRYEETGGAVGHEWNGAHCLVLTTTGHRSGRPRKSALIYGRDGDDVLVIASKGGADEHPLWYRNVQADPNVTVQILDRTFRARARTATAEEKPRQWKIMTESWPNYDVYIRRTTREIPLVVLEPVADDA